MTTATVEVLEPHEVPTATTPLTFREFVKGGILLTDKGKRLEWSPLVEAVVTAVEGGAKEIVIVCPRRSGKSSVVAQLLAWYLLTKPLSFCCTVTPAAHQAEDILTQKLRHPLAMKHEFTGLVESARDRIRVPSNKSAVQVLPAMDVSAPGRTIDLLVVDEARAVNEEAVEVLRPSAAGGVILVLGSPGSKGGWWHRYATDPDEGKVVIHLHDPMELNPTLDRAFVEKEKARLKRRGAWGDLLARREWGGEWVEVTENPLLTAEQVELCCVTDPEKIKALEAKRPGDVCMVGIDLSLTNDLTTICVVAVNLREDTVRLVQADVIDPKTSGGTVPLQIVEQKVEERVRHWRARKAYIDQYQGAQLAQRLTAKGINIELVAVTAGLNQAIFGTLAELVISQKLTWAKNIRLEQELCNLQVEDTKAGGFRITDADSRYHRDLSFSLALACYYAREGVLSAPMIT